MEAEKRSTGAPGAPSVLAGASCPAATTAEEACSKLFELLRDAFGVDFGTYRRTTIERRVQRRMSLYHLERLDDYLGYLARDAAELDGLYDDLLIGVTGFFRDREPFEGLRARVFPRILEHRAADAPIRVWVAGCSTGEEAYSLAIVLLEHLGDRAERRDLQVVATDVDEQALAVGRLGVYPPSIEGDVAPERLRRFFSRWDAGYQVARAVRDHVVFARHILGAPPPCAEVDLVSCRNVLIYMQPALQRKVLHTFHDALCTRGFLLLGTAESIGDTSELFSLLDGKRRIYARKSCVASAVLGFPPSMQVGGAS